MRNAIVAVALLLGSLPGVAKDKPGSAQVTGTIIAPKVVKNFAGYMLELRLYEYDPFLADVGATLVAKKRIKTFAHQEGKESKLTFKLAETASKMPRRSYYITCFVLDAKGNRRLIGEKDGKNGLCKVHEGPKGNRINLILRDLRR